MGVDDKQLLDEKKMINHVLRILRIAFDYKITKLSEITGIPKSTISEIENGKRPPSISIIDSYSKAFKIKKSSIMYFAEKKGTFQQILFEVLKLLDKPDNDSGLENDDNRLNDDNESNRID